MESSAGSETKQQVFQRGVAPYLFHSQTTSLCEICLEPVPAKVILEDHKVFYLKR